MKIFMYITPFKNSIEITLNKITEKRKEEKAERIASISTMDGGASLIIHVQG